MRAAVLAKRPGCLIARLHALGSAEAPLTSETWGSAPLDGGSFPETRLHERIAIDGLDEEELSQLRSLRRTAQAPLECGRIVTGT